MPGVRVTSVRRTVTVAVALVTGQALLCGIIGFVTFGGEGAAAPGSGATAPQLAGPPVVLPPEGTPPPSDPAERPTSGTAKPTRTERPTSPPTTPAVRNSATRAVTPSRKTSVPAVPKPAPSESSPDRALLPPPSPIANDGSPTPVAGERCDDEGAAGRTADDEVVKCERNRDGDLRWRLV
jgi:hypothetical protein